MRIVCVIGMTLAFSASVSSLWADQVIVVADRDNAIFAESNNSGGVATTFQVGTNNNSRVRRGLIRFDVDGAIPAGSMITGATLSMHLDGASSTDSGDREVRLHRLLADWGEGTSAGGGAGGGNGQAPTTNDATWNHRFFDTTAWSTPGGDFAPAASANAAVSTTLGVFHWTSNELVSDVQSWLSNPATNYGWIVLGEEDEGGSSRRFDSRESANADFRPTLTIDYAPVPEPSGALLLLLGAACVSISCRSRRRRA
jgi:hypothetical protein